MIIIVKGKIGWIFKCAGTSTVGQQKSNSSSDTAKSREIFNDTGVSS